MRLRTQGPAPGRVCFRLQTLSDFIRANAEHRLGILKTPIPSPPPCTYLAQVAVQGVIVLVLVGSRRDSAWEQPKAHGTGHPKSNLLGNPREGARRACGPYAGLETDRTDGTPHPKWPILRQRLTTAPSPKEQKREKKRRMRAYSTSSIGTVGTS